MKKILLLVTALISFNVSIFAQSYSIEPIMSLGVAFVKQIETQYPGIIVQKADFDFSLNDNFTYIDMNSDLDYVVAGIGDDNVADISLIVYKNVDGSWVKLKEDSQIKNSASLEIDPSVTGQYAIDIKINNYVAGKNSGHVGLFVMVQTKKK